MAITLVGTSSGDQGLFNQLGVLGGALNDVNSARSTILASAPAALALFEGFGIEVRDAVADLTGAALRQVDQMGSYPASIVAAAERVLIERADADQKLPTRSVEYAQAAVEKQMLTPTTYHVDANTVSAAVTQTSLTGNGVVITSVKDGRGRNLENLLAERITLTCIDTTVAGSETIEARGEEAEADRLSERWPRGSGSVYSFTSIDPAGDGNLVPHGAFDTTDFTVDTPTDWTAVVGTAATHFAPDATEEFAGDACLSFIGDASTLTQLKTTDPLADLESLTPYALNFWLKADVVPAAGVLVVDLFDGSSVIADEAGTNNSLSIDLTGISTSYVAKNVVFRLPEPVPATVYLRVRLSTALSSGSSIFIDSLAMAAMQQPSRAVGRVPFVAVFSGSTNWSLDDGDPNLVNTFKIETANDRASDWQTLWDKLFDSGSSGFILPSSGTTAISDSLIA